MLPGLDDTPMLINYELTRARRDLTFDSHGFCRETRFHRHVTLARRGASFDNSLDNTDSPGPLSVAETINASDFRVRSVT